jgi:pimeloyl-ACP methyl ester carboxylesterase
VASRPAACSRPTAIRSCGAASSFRRAPWTWVLRAPAPILFIHGDADKTVAYSRGRSAFADLAWPKAFVTMHGQGHGEFLDAKRPGFPPAMATMLDFLRWNLYGDTAARDRLAADGTSRGLASIQLSLGS